RTSASVLRRNPAGLYLSHDGPILSRLGSTERELLVMRTWSSERLHRAWPDRGDLHRLAEDFRVVWQELPRSRLVRMVAVGIDRPIEQWKETIDLYEAIEPVP